MTQELLPWLIISERLFPPVEVCRYGTRAEAESSCFFLNRATGVKHYRVIYAPEKLARTELRPNI